MLEGGLRAWEAAGLAAETGATRLLDEADDVVLKPYERGRTAMEDYLRWEELLDDEGAARIPCSRASDRGHAREHRLARRRAGDHIADASVSPPHMLPSPDAFAASVGALGIGGGDRVVGRTPGYAHRGLRRKRATYLSC